MDTTLNPKQTGMRPGLAVDADQEIARAYEQIARADEELARAEEQLSKLEHDDAPGDRLARMNRRGRAIRGFAGLLLAASIGIAAMVSQSSYSDTASPIIARWLPQYIPSSSPVPENRTLPAQPGLATVQAAVDTASRPAALAQTVSESEPTPAGLSPELTQLLLSMTRDLATVGQGIEQLKAGQQQMAHDNANTAEQLKAIQEKMARVVAKASEANLRPTSAPPLRLATPTRKPVLTQQSPQARAPPQAPTQLQSDDQ